MEAIIIKKKSPKIKNFSDSFYEIVVEAGEFIIDRTTKAESIDIYDTENTLYETVLSDRYQGIYSIYELVSTYCEDGKVYIKGVDTVDRKEYNFNLKDLSPDTICHIADKIREYEQSV